MNSNRRTFPRLETPELFVTEIDGDFQYTLPAQNMSMGGIFLTGRMKSKRPQINLRIPLREKYITVSAQPIYDRKLKSGFYGTGYRFIALTDDQQRALTLYFNEHVLKQVVRLFRF